MTLSKGINATVATQTKSRTPQSLSPFSGMCTVCIEGCTGLCEVGKSSFRGREVIYPQPFGRMTTAAEKDYPVDYSHFNIMGGVVGARGIEADSDKAIFSAVDLSTSIGAKDKIKLKFPLVIPGLGSTKVAKVNWDGLAIGTAITGTILTIGENVCGMDPDAEFKNGKVVSSPDMKRRVELFQRWQNGYGAIIVQNNVEDTKLGVAEYVIDKLGVEVIELKWGQGAKNIGGEVKLNTLERALQLKSRGYIVQPDPESPEVQEAFKLGAFKEFERHSRIGMVTNEGFHKRVEYLRKLGAKYITLKTGAYRPVDLARAVKLCSEAKIDLLTVDGAGGGTGMSPWRMMNEWGVPMVYLHSLLYKYLSRLAERGEFVPDIALTGGFTLEDHMFKGFAIGAPFVKLIGMARTPLTAVMVGKTLGDAISFGNVPAAIARNYGETLEQIFNSVVELKKEFGKDFAQIPPAAIALYTYYDRLAVGLKQLMCGVRRFTLEHITRDELAALTREAAEISGLKYVMDLDEEEAEKILNS